MFLRLLRDLEAFLYGVPFHPFLFAMYPVLLLYSGNLNEVQPSDVAGPLLLVLGVASVGYLVLARMINQVHVAALITTALIVTVLAFGRISELIEPVWAGDPRILAVVAIGLVAALAIAAHLGRARMGSVTAAVNLASVVLLVLVVVPIGTFLADEWGRPNAVPSRTAGLRLTPSSATYRDVYHLVFDRYGSTASFDTAYDFDNGPFIDWLRDEGFMVVEDARANYVRTTLSLASTLGMALLDDVAQRVGEDGGSYRPVVDRIQHSPAARLLQDLGYEYVHIGSWFPDTRGSQTADRVFAAGRSESFLTALSDLSIVPIIAEGRTYPGPSHARSAQYQFDVLEDISGDPGPKYVFAHILLPHPPFVFLDDGTVDPGEADMQSQLAYTNGRIQALLEPLLTLPEDERPIIILQSDEGPYPQRQTDDINGFQWADATDEELVTKFGVLMAFLLPGPEGEEPMPEQMSLVNTFPEIFRRYFGLVGAEQPDRSFTSQVGTPYALAEITARLDGIVPDVSGGVKTERLAPEG